MKNYREIKTVGLTLDEVIEMLQAYHARGERVYINFNGHMLCSDTVTVNSAYIQVTGETKPEYERAQKQFYEEIRREEEAHASQIPALTQEWTNKGQAVLDAKYWEKWSDCVPIRLSDIYRGAELGACLDIIKPLNNGCEFNEAAKILNGQNRSGTSYSLVCSMVAAFCDRGMEFVHYVNNAV